MNAYLALVGRQTNAQIIDTYAMTALWEGCNKSLLRRVSAATFCVCVYIYLSYLLCVFSWILQRVMWWLEPFVAGDTGPSL